MNRKYDEKQKKNRLIIFNKYRPICFSVRVCIVFTVALFIARYNWPMFCDSLINDQLTWFTHCHVALTCHRTCRRPRTETVSRHRFVFARNQSLALRIRGIVEFERRTTQRVLRMTFPSTRQTPWRSDKRTCCVRDFHSDDVTNAIAGPTTNRTSSCGTRMTNDERIRRDRRRLPKTQSRVENEHQSLCNDNDFQV